jgi:hypothetical protein
VVEKDWFGVLDQEKVDRFKLIAFSDVDELRLKDEIISFNEWDYKIGRVIGFVEAA